MEDLLSGRAVASSPVPGGPELDSEEIEDLEDAPEGEVEAVDRDRLRGLMQRHALAEDTMDTSRLHAVREEMERADARRLQPHFIESFFLEAFKCLGGTARQREPRRYRISHVPEVVRRRAREMGTREARACPVRADRFREVSGGAARTAAGGLRLPRTPAARRRT